METKIAIVLKDVFGGDGITRAMPVKDNKLSRTKTSKRTLLLNLSWWYNPPQRGV